MFILQLIYKILRAFVGLMGFNLVVTQKRKKRSTDDYEQIFPSATYAPWLSDRLFKKTYEIIKDYTLVGKYRCYDLWQLVEQAAKLKGALIEIGTWKGGSGALIAQKAKLSKIKNKVYLCDTFRGVVKAGGKDSVYRGGEHADTSKEIVKGLVDRLNLDNTEIIVGIFPEETSYLISDETFCFCHIDVDVYQSAKDIIEWIWPKLVVGGIVVFDDYGFERCFGVTRVVNEERNKEDRVCIYNLNGHGILIKIAN